MNAVTVAGVVSTLLFLGSNLPMVVRAARTRDLRSYSRGNLVMTNVGNAVYTVYVLSLPAGPIWLLHLVYTAVSAFMLLVHICWTPRVLTTWNARLPRRLGRRTQLQETATTPTLFLDLDVMEFGDQASSYVGAVIAARR
jgi:uncharacterized protein with PQ loop repeat